MSFGARIMQILQKENFCEILHTSCPNIIKKSEKRNDFFVSLKYSLLFCEQQIEKVNDE